MWSLRLSAVLYSRDLSDVVFNIDGDIERGTKSGSAGEKLRLNQKIRKAKAIVVMSLGYMPLRVVQSVSHPADMIKKLNDRNAASTTANKMAVMTSLINTRYDGSKDMGEYLSEMEIRLNKLEEMGSLVEEGMQMAIILVSVSSFNSLNSTVSAIKTMDPDKATWDYVWARLIEEMRSQKLINGMETVSIKTTVSFVRKEPVRHTLLQVQ